jgi:hypothetical protein
MSRTVRRAMRHFKAALPKAGKTSESVKTGASLNRFSITGERDSGRDGNSRAVHMHECPPLAFLNVGCE